MGRRILNRKELRADYDAAERREKPEDEEEEDEDEDEDEDEEGGEGDEEEDAGEADAESEGDEDDEALEIIKKKKKPAKAAKPPKAPKAPAKGKSRARSAKTTRMKVVWGVFNNSNQRVAVYDYPKRKEADEHAARLTTDKKQTHFVQPVKEPFEEKVKE